MGGNNNLLNKLLYELLTQLHVNDIPFTTAGMFK